MSKGMTKEQLCRLAHYLFVLDTYLFQEEGRGEQRKEIAELRRVIADAAREMEETE